MTDNLATQSCPLADGEDAPPEPRIKIHASLFFDGTLNNRTNVEIGADEAAWGSNLGSYDNDYSNISKLEDFWAEDPAADHSFSIYVEGIGTQTRGADVPQGMATGRGITGVTAKVESGIRQLISRIDALGSNRQVDYIHLDAFGFSRGAAAARYFVYAVLQDSGSTLRDQLTARGYSINDISVKFIGLFDTVASYGLDHSNDTSDLHLDAISDAERVVQLAAAEEHRENFRLTNIDSASDGLEIFLPGVHSDVGGGYNHNSNETDLQILDIDRTWGLSDADRAAFTRERSWLLRSGWYTSDEIQEVNAWNELKVSRSGISNRYSRIPLHVMARYARENNVNISRRIRTVHSVPSALRRVEQAVDSYINDLGTSHPNDWFHSNTAMMRELRHGYLHFSSFYGGTNQPQFTDDDPIHGRRRRVIQNG